MLDEFFTDPDSDIPEAARIEFLNKNGLPGDDLPTIKRNLQMFRKADNNLTKLCYQRGAWLIAKLPIMLEVSLDDPELLDEIRHLDNFCLAECTCSWHPESDKKIYEGMPFVLYVPTEHGWYVCGYKVSALQGECPNHTFAPDHLAADLMSYTCVPQDTLLSGEPFEVPADILGT